MTRWQLQEAKARFSEVVKSAQREPQEITVHGTATAVVVSRAEYDRLRRKKISFVEFMRRSPAIGADLKIERDKSLPRPVRV